MKQIAKTLVVISSFLICFSSFAQNTGKNSDAYKDFVKSRNSEYKDWRKKANAEFSDYLAKAWEEFMVQSGRKDPIGPVPDKPTYYGDENGVGKSLGSHGYPSEGSFSLPAHSTSLSMSASYLPEDNNVSVDFFGVDKIIPFDRGMIVSVPKAKEKELASAWTVMSESSFLPTVDAISAIKNEFFLSDWATYMLVKKLTEAVYNDKLINERVATQMFIMCQLKYKVRVGAAGEDLVMLLPFKEQIYQVSYITDNNLDLFIFGYKKMNSQTPLYTFTKDFSISENIISLTISQPMKIGGDSEYKSVEQPLWSNILGENFKVPVNEPYISLAYDYPQSDLLIYHHSAVNTQTAKAIIRAVKFKIIKEGLGDNEEKAVAFILNLVQNGFDYKTDYEMFGRSKPLFIEESFYYGSNNCKDRVLIFSWLVKNTLGLNTVMFGYPNHVACGVKFTQPVTGDSFVYNGDKFVMCDPTFINAPIGATMPKYKGMEPVVIEL